MSIVVAFAGDHLAAAAAVRAQLQEGVPACHHAPLHALVAYLV